MKRNAPTPTSTTLLPMWSECLRSSVSLRSWTIISARQRFRKGV